MSIIILIVIVVLLVVLEKFWMPSALGAIRREGSCDHYLAEPGETVIWTSKVENHGRWPVPFVRLREEFPGKARILAEEEWLRSHCRVSNQLHMEHKISLSARRSAVRSAAFSLPERGVYHVGRGNLSVGDLLGLREETVPLEGSTLVVMPERSKNSKALDTAGGFLGDISVRRFILEDPVLTVGFRDYTGREPLKSISWTRTAMAGSLQVKQYDYTSEQTAVVLLNVSGASGETLEECLRLTRSVCETLEKKKIPFSLRTNGNLPGPVSKLFFLAEGLGESHLNTILYALGRADDTCFYSFRTLAKQALRSRRYSDAYIVITPPLRPEDSAVIGQLEAEGGRAVCVLEVEV